MHLHARSTRIPVRTGLDRTGRSHEECKPNNGWSVDEAGAPQVSYFDGLAVLVASRQEQEDSFLSEEIGTTEGFQSNCSATRAIALTCSSALHATRSSEAIQPEKCPNPIHRTIHFKQLEKEDSIYYPLPPKHSILPRWRVWAQPDVHIMFSRPCSWCFSRPLRMGYAECRADPTSDPPSSMP
jgi:hypothetical protein